MAFGILHDICQSGRRYLRHVVRWKVVVKEFSCGSPLKRVYFDSLSTDGLPLPMHLNDTDSLLQKNATVLAGFDESAPVAAERLPAASVQFIVVFILCNMLLVATKLLSSSLFLAVSSWTSRVVYKEMMARILRAPMSYFDVTPKARITTLCTNDTDALDSRVSEPLSQTAQTVGIVLTAIVMLFYSLGPLALGVIPVMISYFALYNRMSSAHRDLIRIEGATKAPINTAFSESLHGVHTIRAFGRQDDYLKQLHQRIETWGRAFYHKESCDRWLGIRMDAAGITLVGFVGFAAVLRSDIGPGMMAVAITSILNNMDMFSNLVGAVNRMTNCMDSVERIQETTLLPQERDFHIADYPPPAGWPAHGGIEFEQVCFRYRDSLPLVLDNLTFKIKPGEKIGVIGRTGAGKSSLLTTLPSLAPLAGGRITVDGVDVNKLGVGDLRSRLAVIPQDPVMFGGSVKRNLDPFLSHSEDEIWATLRRVHLAEFVQSLPAGINTEVAEDGGNLSLGQRQLICVGRALLRRAMILLLDEASSSIDLETDHLFQKTLREEFSACTTITIAHRLATIMSSDRVLVMDSGKARIRSSSRSSCSSCLSILSTTSTDSSISFRGCIWPLTRFCSQGTGWHCRSLSSLP